MNFQKIILSIAGIMLVITLLIIGYSMYFMKYDTKFPPIISQCPDYWVNVPLESNMTSNASDSMCVNKKDLGKDICPKQMNFNDSVWQGNRGMCMKKVWANECDLTWDGITNNNEICKY
jgi:hypothetical protein